MRVMQQLWGNCEGDAATVGQQKVRVGNCGATVKVMQQLCGNCEGDAATVGQM